VESRRLRRVGDGSPASSARPGIVRAVVAVLAALSGSIAGWMLWVPLSVVTPFWIVLTLPQISGAVFAASAAYLFAGPARKRLSHAMALSLTVAALCAAANLLLFLGVIPGIPSTSGLLPPGGPNTLLAESLLIGAVAGVLAPRGRRERQRGWLPSLVALLLSALALAVLLLVGSAILSTLWLGVPEPNA